MVVSAAAPPDFTLRSVTEKEEGDLTVTGRRSPRRRKKDFTGTEEGVHGEDLRRKRPHGEGRSLTEKPDTLRSPIKKEEGHLTATGRRSLRRRKKTIIQVQ
jgi:hypothetical protein